MDRQRRRLSVGVNSGASALAENDTAGQTLAHILATHKINGKNLTCIHSVTDREMGKKKHYEEKDQIACQDGQVPSDVSKAAEAFKCIGFTCKKGAKPDSPNQDSFVAVTLPAEWSLFGVFDGHGPCGHFLSHFAVQNLVLHFLDKEFLPDPSKTFRDSFRETQKDIEQADEAKVLQASSSGTTCTVAFHDIKADQLTLAHVADSRAVVYTDQEVHVQTEDHKPNLPKEKERIELNGGRVIFDGFFNHRVFSAKGMYPGLNMSRALGDLVAHREAGLIAEPEITVVDLAKLREKGVVTIVISSDGVWEFLDCDQAVQILFEDKKLSVGPEPVNRLARASWDKWMADSNNEIADDITVVAMQP